MFGLWDDDGSGNMIWDPAEWAAIEAEFGKLGLVHYGDGLIPDLETMKLAASHGGTPYLDWGSGVNIADVVAGKYDPNFTAIDLAARALGQTIIFRPLWEMNLAAPPWSSAGRPNAATYIAAWRHIHAILTAPNLKWHWCPNYFVPAWGGGAPDPSPWFPGTDVVDYTGADIYMESANAQTVAGPILAALEKLGKPAIIGEWGVSAGKSPNRPAVIKEFLGLLPPWVVGQCYFNWNDNGKDWRLDAAGAAALKAAA